MSYLGPLRLHFGGTFRAAVSTVNNDPTASSGSRWILEEQEASAGRGRDPGLSILTQC